MNLLTTTKTRIILLVFVLIFILVFVMVKRHVEPESFSASDESIEMRLPVEEFQRRTTTIEALLTDELPKSLERCTALGEWVCGALGYQESRLDEEIRDQAKALAPSNVDLQNAYMDRQKQAAWTNMKKSDPLLECFQVQRQIPVNQQQATSRLERAVIQLEEFLESPAMVQAKAQLTKVARGLDFLARTPFPPPLALTDLYTQGACPSDMFEFGPTQDLSDTRCCPVEPRKYSTKSHMFTECGVEKLGTEVTCSLKETSELPTCRPAPIQGPCLPDYFFFAASRGGQCCPVPPTKYDTAAGEYTACPRVAKDGRTLCALSAKGDAKAKGIPLCAGAIEGFQTRGRALLERSDAAMAEARRFVGDVGKAEQRVAAFRFPEPLQVLTSSPGISHSSPSP